MKDPYPDKAVAGEDNRMKSRNHGSRLPVTAFVGFGHNSLDSRVVQVVDAKNHRRRQLYTQIDGGSSRGSLVDIEGCCKAAK